MAEAQVCEMVDLILAVLDEERVPRGVLKVPTKFLPHLRFKKAWANGYGAVNYFKPGEKETARYALKEKAGYTSEIPDELFSHILEEMLQLWGEHLKRGEMLQSVTVEIKLEPTKLKRRITPILGLVNGKWYSIQLTLRQDGPNAILECELEWTTFQLRWMFFDWCEKARSCFEDHEQLEPETALDPEPVKTPRKTAPKAHAEDKKLQSFARANHFKATLVESAKLITVELQYAHPSHINENALNVALADVADAHKGELLSVTQVEGHIEMSIDFDAKDKADILPAVEAIHSAYLEWLEQNKTASAVTRTEAYC